MNTQLYYITCLTNLHVGSGDINFNIVDREVEKDPTDGTPVVHSSGIKGALRDAYKKTSGYDSKEENRIFGGPGDNTKDDSTGEYHFLNARLLSRPLRAWGKVSSVPVTTVEILNDFVSTLTAFGITPPVPAISVNFPADKDFLASEENIQVEGMPTGVLDRSIVNALKPLFDGPFAVAKSLGDYDLPVIARNNLQTKKGNLWYEEYVPHGSRFWEILLTPDGETVSEDVIPELVQLGGNASIGYGYCKFENKTPKEDGK
ncbi:MAG: type III-B CRISPR module RAMP protein Cmr4 [Clostridia bacterium]|nr:type III-B CRISPR module RAMP protein Cmr4 [Clostridia bacterium]